MRTLHLLPLIYVARYLLITCARCASGILYIKLIWIFHLYYICLYFRYITCCRHLIQKSKGRDNISLGSLTEADSLSDPHEKRAQLTVHFHDGVTPGAFQDLRGTSDELFLRGDEWLTTMSPYFTLKRDAKVVFFFSKEFPF